ncbi:MAG: hypothetical protein QM612_03505 [Thermomonas sp.]|uniref:hypothetical protein n=1 Tax=Thermomonas sp. TaxID=1971895 RepID=UPI0039E5C53E
MTVKVVEGAGYRLEFEYEAPRLRVRIIGGEDTGHRVSVEYWLRIAEEVRARGAQQLLALDAMQGEAMGPEELQRFFDAISGHGLEQVRLAYVEGRLDQMSRIEYAELLARERGYDIRMFSNEAEAEVWLRYGMR